MTGDAKVMAALQEGINKEESLALLYFLNGKHLQQGLGITPGKELKGLGKQCCTYKKRLLKRLFFLGGSPEIAPDVATVIGDGGPGAIFDEMLSLENEIIDQYTIATKTCYEANDMEAFHVFQHLVKAHTIGEKGVGHIQYIEHEQTQLEKLGEVQYIAAHI